MINHNENKDENEYRYDTIRLGLDMDTIIVNIKSLSIMMPICI